MHYFNFSQVEAWMNEKLQLAKDESYRDPVNLETKRKKHKEFEAEVRANEARIQTIANVISLPWL